MRLGTRDGVHRLDRRAERDRCEAITHSNPERTDLTALDDRTGVVTGRMILARDPLHDPSPNQAEPGRPSCDHTTNQSAHRPPSVPRATDRTPETE